MLSIAREAENDNFPWLIVSIKLHVFKDKIKDTFTFDLKKKLISHSDISTFRCFLGENE